MNFSAYVVMVKTHYMQGREIQNVKLPPKFENNGNRICN